MFSYLLRTKIFHCDNYVISIYAVKGLNVLSWSVYSAQHSGGDSARVSEVTMENSYTTYFSVDLNLEKHRLDGSSTPQPSTPEDSCLVALSIVHENISLSLSLRLRDKLAFLPLPLKAL